MKRLLAIILALFTAPLTLASTTVNATLVQANGQPATYAFLQFDLRYCGYNLPTIPSQSFNMPLKSYRFTPAQLPATIFGNDEITCGNSYSTLWHVTAYSDANTPVAGDSDYVICSSTAALSYCPVPAGSWNLATAQPFTGTAPPPGFQSIFANPRLSQKLVQPSGTSLQLYGTIDFTNAQVVGFTSSSTNATQIQGLVVASSGNTNNYALTWVAADNQIEWKPTGTSANASQLQGFNICATTPVAGQVLTYGANWCGASVSGFLPLAGGTLTGLLTLSGNPTTALQAAPKQYIDGLLPSKADLVTGKVPTAELGSGAASSSTCLLGNQTWAACPGGSGNTNNGAQFFLPYYSGTGTQNILSQSKWSDNLTTGSYTGSQFQVPFGTKPAPGLSFAGLSGLGLYLVTHPNTWSVTATSTSSGTATITLSNTSGWAFTYIAGEYFITSGIGGGYDCAIAAPCLITAVNTGAQQVSYLSAGTGSFSSGTFNLLTIGMSAAAHKVTFNSLHSSSLNSAEFGSIQLGPSDPITSHSTSDNLDVTLLRRAQAGDLKRAELGGTYGTLTPGPAEFSGNATVDGNFTVTGSCSGCGSGLNSGTQYQGVYYAANGVQGSPDPNVTSNTTTWISGHPNGIQSSATGPAITGPIGAAFVVPGAGNSKLGLDTDGNFYDSANGGTKAQELDALNLTRGQRVFGASRGNGVNVSAGTEYEYTVLLAGATADARLQQCITDLASTGGICDMTGEANSITPSATVTITTNNITIYWVSGTYTEPTNVTINISGNNDSVVCLQKWTCVIDASGNGAVGAFNVNAGQNNMLAGFKVLGGRLTSQVGFEVNISGSHNIMQDMWIVNGGAWGAQFTNCYACSGIRNRIEQASRAGIGVTGATLAVSTATRSGTTATITTTAAQIIGGSGTRTFVDMQSCSLAPYNGVFLATSTGANTFTYTMASDPGGSATTCTYTIYTQGTVLSDNVLIDNNTIDSGDAGLAIQSASGIGVVNGTVVKNNFVRYNAYGTTSCNGDITGATQLGLASLTGNGATITATVSGGVTAPNQMMLTSPTASQVSFTGITSGGLSNGTLFTVASVGATTFTITNANCNATCGGTITFVIAGHGTNATGCSEGIQQTDKATDTEIAANTVVNSYRESYASSGTGLNMHHNRCFNPALIGGSGSGCYMLSVSNGGGLSIAGDAIFSHNIATNAGTNASAYAFSVQAGTGSSSTTFQNIVISDNQIDGGTTAFGTGVRWSNASANTMTLKNINVHDNGMVGVTTPLSLTSSNTTGAVTSTNNGTMIQGVPLTVALGTTTVNANTCNTVAGSPFSTTGITTGSRLSWSFAATPAGVTGYAPTATTLNVITYPTANNINVLLCNPTGGGITPQAMSIVVDARNP